LDVGGVLCDGFVELGDFVSLGIGEDFALLGFEFSGFAVGLSFGDDLLLLGAEAFEFGFLFSTSCSRSFLDSMARVMKGGRLMSRMRMSRQTMPRSLR
jgi:hypothetical protein